MRGKANDITIEIDINSVAIFEFAYLDENEHFRWPEKILSMKSKLKITHIDNDYLAISPNLRNVLKISLHKF